MACPYTMAKSILVTGCAGFIGFHLCRRLLTEGEEVCGLDNLNEYYDVGLKRARLGQLGGNPGFHFLQLDLANRNETVRFFQDQRVDIVVNLAAQPGIRYSLTNPSAYVDSNLTGFANVLEGCRHSGVRHLIFASSSSVYGANTQMPSSVHQNTDHPISLYAATKKANELMAHAYSHVFRLPCTGIRFFTIYGPWGRPDMALFLFTSAILAGEPVRLFNAGRMRRDFTYIDDAVEGVVRLLDEAPQGNPDWNGDDPDPATSSAPYRILNLGAQNPVELITLLRLLEAKLGRKAKVIFEPLQPGDVPATSAEVDDLMRKTGFRPQTPIQLGVERFVDWYREYYRV